MLQSRQVLCLIFGILLTLQWTGCAVQTDNDNTSIVTLNLPDSKLVTAYQRAAEQSVLPAINPEIFFGYWSVCADGVGHGHGNTYPSLDGHQMTDALLWLGKIDVVKANWEYVKKFQRPNGQLPLAILPSYAGKEIGKSESLEKVDENGGFYRHWVKGDPLRALAGPTYIQNADVIYRYTQDYKWLTEQLPSVNKAADYLETLVTKDGAVKGAGYYVERPTRIEYDGVAQCYAIDAFRRAAKLNTVAGNTKEAKHYNAIADKIKHYFQSQFWRGNQFAEYIHPERGPITLHGLTDTDWSAIALGVANSDQTTTLWPQLKNEPLFYYGGVPSGIATHPEKYEKWEFAYDDQMDLAAMGRVWYLEAQARARMGDSDGLLNSIRLVCERGEKDGYYWRERYNDKGGFGAEKYCEYPANLIRIIQRFLLGVDFCLDGAVSLAPVVPDDFWKTGFGQTLSWQQKKLSYLMKNNGMEGDYSGPCSQQLRVKLQKALNNKSVSLKINGNNANFDIKDGEIIFTVPKARTEEPCHFVVSIVTE